MCIPKKKLSLLGEEEVFLQTQQKEDKFANLERKAIAANWWKISCSKPYISPGEKDELSSHIKDHIDELSSHIKDHILQKV